MRHERGKSFPYPFQTNHLSTCTDITQHRGNILQNDGREPTVSVSKTNSGVPLFGHSTQLRVFVDPDLLQYDEVWAAAGTWNVNFGAATADIVRAAGGVVTDLKRV